MHHLTKGPVDRVGAALKRPATQKVMARQCNIISAQDFVSAVQGSSITTTLVLEEDMAEKYRTLRLEEVFSGAPHGINSHQGNLGVPLCAVGGREIQH